MSADELPGSVTGQPALPCFQRSSPQEAVDVLQQIVDGLVSQRLVRLQRLRAHRVEIPSVGPGHHRIVDVQQLAQDAAEGVDIGLQSRASPRTCSGAANRLDSQRGVSVASIAAPDADSRRDTPKSTSFTRPSSFTRMFSGFRSRWRTSFRCASGAPHRPPETGPGAGGCRGHAAARDRSGIAVDVLHGEPRRVVADAGVVEPRDGRVVEAGEGALFRVEVRRRSGDASNPGRNLIATMSPRSSRSAR